MRIMKKKILFVTIALCQLSFSCCFKINNIGASIAIVNNTDSAIKFEGYVFRINETENNDSRKKIECELLPKDKCEIINYYGPIESFDINNVLKQYDIGRITFHDSSFIDYCKDRQYPKSPYTHLELDWIEDYPNGFQTNYYIYSIDEADHQWAIEHSSQP